MIYHAKKVPITDPNIASYLPMLNDRWRNEFFYRALEKHARDRVVLDVGTGTGILAFYALRHGAKFVYCVERWDAMVDISDRVLSANFDRSRFRVIKADFWTSEMDGKINHPIDILVSETVSSGLFDQGMIHTWSCARSYLAENAICIPDRLHCDVWIWDEKINPWDPLDPLPSNTFFPDESLDQDFARSLIDIDTGMDREMYWLKINKINRIPQSIITDVLNYTYHVMPPVEFSEQDYPLHIIPKIEFDIDVAAGSTMSIINKISFENSTLYLKDAKYMSWQFAPSFFLKDTGTYRFNYNNLRFEIKCATEWTYQII